MLSTGYMNPDRRIAGRKNRNMPMNASCCVLEIVEMSSPTPRLGQDEERGTRAKSSSALPRNGTSNQSSATTVDQHEVHEAR